MRLIDRFAVWWCWTRRIGIIESMRLDSTDITVYQVAVPKPAKNVRLGSLVRVVRP